MCKMLRKPLHYIIEDVECMCVCACARMFVYNANFHTNVYKNYLTP